MDTSETTSNRRTVRLKPKAAAQAIRRGFPWAYASEIAADRRTRALAPGTIAQLEDADRRPLGTVAVNPQSKIFARMLDSRPDAEIDHAWLAARLEAALSHRARLYDTPFYRWVHAEADGLPGVVIDRFGDTIVLQPNAAWADRLCGPLADAAVSVGGIVHVFKNASGRTRTLEGLDDRSDWLIGGGESAGLIRVPMNGASYLADTRDGQKTGLFFDQRPNHAFFASLAAGSAVLDVFSHVGGFSLAALAGGAARALAVDASARALELAEAGANESGFGERLETRRGDAFDVLGELSEAGETFEAVVCDPPAFAPHKAALDAGLRAYERVARLAAPLVAQHGYLVLCSCSHAADLDRFRAACLRGIGRAGRRAQIVHTGFAGPDHPLHPALAESGYLKVLFFRLVE
ncbi:MAG: class I SAM-dependent rRNA methyltransferase [Pseudomonadota bacterium]